MFPIIEHTKFELIEKDNGLCLITADDEYPLPGQSVEETNHTINENFAIVTAKYKKTDTGTIPEDELHEVCLKIVLYYFFLYNSWKSLYKKEKNRSLIFLEKDFTHPYTYNIVIQYFKNKYPKEYAGKCAAMLGITTEALLKYEVDRENFYSTFR